MSRVVPAKQYRAITIAVIIAIIFGAYFLRHFFSAVIFAAISAYLFNPIYDWFLSRSKNKARSASLTLVVALLIMLIPVILILTFAVIQINHLITYLESSANANVGSAGQHFLDWINNILAKFPGTHQLTMAELQDSIKNSLEAIARGVANLIVSSVSTISGAITNLFIFVYTFVNLLTHRDYILDMIRKINPLGESLNQEYVEKAGAMTGAMAKGQFVIAFCQGFADALILQLAGVHGVFFFMFILLSLLSIIPLGGGIITIPIGIIMILGGDIWQGLFVIAGHLLFVTNIDNVLRPRLVPQSIRLNPALTLLAVFSGLAMFGFLGIVIGPVIMIVIKLTIEAYIELSQSKSSTTT